MKNEKHEIIPVSSAELNEIAEFISIENDSDTVNASYLTWWYFLGGAGVICF